jgi:hypothetical protein
MVPTCIRRVVRTLACPAIGDTSVGLSFQVNRAVVQNTCRRLCQVHLPWPSASRQPAARQPGLSGGDCHQLVEIPVPPRGQGLAKPVYVGVSRDFDGVDPHCRLSGDGHPLGGWRTVPRLHGPSTVLVHIDISATPMPASSPKVRKTAGQLTLA